MEYWKNGILEYCEKTGINQGITEGKIEIAALLKDWGYDVRAISEITGLSLEVVKSIPGL